MIWGHYSIQFPFFGPQWNLFEVSYFSDFCITWRSRNECFIEADLVHNYPLFLKPLYHVHIYVGLARVQCRFPKNKNKIMSTFKNFMQSAIVRTIFQSPLSFSESANIDISFEVLYRLLFTFISYHINSLNKKKKKSITWLNKNRTHYYYI